MGSARDRVGRGSRFSCPRPISCSTNVHFPGPAFGQRRGKKPEGLFGCAGRIISTLKSDRIDQAEGIQLPAAQHHKHQANGNHNGLRADARSNEDSMVKIVVASGACALTAF